MKTFKILGMALFAVLMCVNLVSCSNEENDVPQSGKEITVSLGFKGEYEVSESPLSRAGGDDLYYIFVIDKSNSNAKYAVGLFNDVSALKIKLIEGNKYSFSAWIIKNGMTKLAQTDGVFSKPFPENTSLSEEGFTYSNNWNSADPWFKLSDEETYAIPNLDFYITPTSQEYVASKESTNVEFQIIRYSFGAEFIAENLTEGSLKVSLRGTSIDSGQILNSPTFEVTKNQSVNEIFILPAARTSDSLNPEYAELTVVCTWIKANGDEVELGEPTIVFKRNTKKTIKIKVAKDVENGFTFTCYDDETMGNGGTYNVDGNTATQE